ncbi:MAG: hypothetical protein ACYCYO_10500 [Bacilli bacterium]
MKCARSGFSWLIVGAAAYGGTIEATSSLGSGTVMTVHWPLVEA